MHPKGVSRGVSALEKWIVQLHVSYATTFFKIYEGILFVPTSQEVFLYSAKYCSFEMIFSPYQKCQKV